MRELLEKAFSIIAESATFPSDEHLNKILERHHEGSANRNSNLADHYREKASSARSRGDYASALAHEKESKQREFSAKLHNIAAKKLKEGHPDARELSQVANQHDEVHLSVRHPKHVEEYSYTGKDFDKNGYFKG